MNSNDLNAADVAANAARVRAAVPRPPEAPAPTPPNASPAPSVRAVLASANTHRVGLSGLFVAFGALAVHIAAQLVAGHVVGASPVVAIALSEIDTWVATPALGAGAFAAYLGRPATV
jgi:hypothetical protein